MKKKINFWDKPEVHALIALIIAFYICGLLEK